MSRLSTAVGAAAVAGAGFAVTNARVRGYDQLDPGLRTARRRLRSPGLNPVLLRLARRRFGRATECAPGVLAERHRITSADGASITVHVYTPGNATPGGPVMLYTHGGGLIMGSAAGYQLQVSQHARDLGIVVVSTDYRLAPEHPFPAALDDIHAAYRWVGRQADSWQVDASRLVVVGDSAGGGLTAALCQRLRDEGSPMPALQVLIYPMLDDRTTSRPRSATVGELVWRPASNDLGWSSYLGEAASDPPPYAVPARCTDLTGLPPAWIGVGDLDLFHDEDVEYAQRLRAAGVPCTLDVVPGAFHGFDVLSDAPVVGTFLASWMGAIRSALGIEPPEES